MARVLAAHARGRHAAVVRSPFVGRLAPIVARRRKLRISGVITARASVIGTPTDLRARGRLALVVDQIVAQSRNGLGFGIRVRVFLEGNRRRVGTFASSIAGRRRGFFAGDCCGLCLHRAIVAVESRRSGDVAVPAPTRAGIRHFLEVNLDNDVVIRHLKGLCGFIPFKGS